MFLLGIIAGSFLNCCLFRLAKKVPLWGRSFCPQCRKKLWNRDLVPLFSFLRLKGKCRFCKKPIGKSYFFIELVTGTLFALVFIKYGAFSWFLVRDLFFVFTLIFILIFDWRHYLILDKIIWPAFFISLIVNLVLGIGYWGLLMGLIIGAGFFGVQYLLSAQKWVGLGDVKLGALLGVMLGWQFTLLTLALAYLIGGFLATILLLTKKKKIGDILPMGSFLAAAAIIVIIWGDLILTYFTL